MQQIDFKLRFDEGNIADLSDIVDGNGNQLYKYAYFGTNNRYTYLVLNHYSMPVKVVKVGKKTINGLTCYYIKVSKSYPDHEYVFMTKEIKEGHRVVVLSKDHTKSFANSRILISFDEEEFADRLFAINIDAENEIDYPFDFPAKHNNGLLPSIDYPEKNDYKSPDIKDALKSFDVKHYQKRNYQAPPPVNYSIPPPLTVSYDDDNQRTPFTNAVEDFNFELNESEKPSVNTPFEYVVIDTSKVPSTQPRAKYSSALTGIKNKTTKSDFHFETPNDNRTMDPAQRRQNIMNRTFDSGSSIPPTTTTRQRPVIEDPDDRYNRDYKFRMEMTAEKQIQREKIREEYRKEQMQREAKGNSPKEDFGNK